MAGKKNKNAAVRRARPMPAPVRKAAAGSTASARKSQPATRGGRAKPKLKAASRAPAIMASMAADAATATNQATQERHYLQARRIEDIAQAFVSLTSELWIVKDRMAVLEQVLDRHGIPAPTAIEAYSPAGEFKSKLDAERRAWAQRMIAALFPRGLPKVD